MTRDRGRHSQPCSGAGRCKKCCRAVSSVRGILEALGLAPSFPDPRPAAVTGAGQQCCVPTCAPLPGGWGALGARGAAGVAVAEAGPCLAAVNQPLARPSTAPCPAPCAPSRGQPSVSGC